jgi:hypothetical protein
MTEVTFYFETIEDRNDGIGCTKIQVIKTLHIDGNNMDSPVLFHEGILESGCR